jgi:hypothetical protein
MSNLFSAVLIVFVLVLVSAFRYRIFAALRRFDQNNALRRAEEARALFDRYAHYRQTVQFAEEEVEDVAKLTVPDERTGEPVTRYIFLGEQFATRKEAEAARYAAVIEKAREFYKDLDRIYLSRRGRERPMAAGPGLPNPAKGDGRTRGT